MASSVLSSTAPGLSREGGNEGSAANGISSSGGNENRGLGPQRSRVSLRAGRVPSDDANRGQHNSLRKAAAALVNDHSRYATNPEDQQFFREHVLRSVGPGSTEGLLLWAESEADALSPQPSSSHNGRAVYGAVTPLHQWARVHALSPPSTSTITTQELRPTTAAPCSATSSVSESADLPSRWRRADALLEMEALLTSLAATNDGAGSPEATQHQGAVNVADDESPSQVLQYLLQRYNLLSLCASGDKVSNEGTHAVAALPTAGSAALGLAGILPPPGTAQSSLTSFFTFTDDEYAALDAAREDGFTFDLASTRKLFELYERYGSFIVVADRWTSPSPVRGKRPRSDDGGASSAAAEKRASPSSTVSLVPSPQTPTVEALCCEYQRVTQGVVLQRARRLQQALLPFYRAEPHGGGGGGPCAAVKETNLHGKTGDEDEPHVNGDSADGSAEDRSLVEALQKLNQHPLMTLLRRHPFLKHCEAQRLLSPPQREQHADCPHGSSSAHDTLSPQVAGLSLATPAHEEQSGPARPALTPVQQFRLLTTPCSLTSATEGGPQERWYDAQGEQQRRRGLEQVLRKESTVNIPFQRAAAAYLALVPRVAHVLRRLQGLTSTASSLPERFADASLFDVPLRALPEVDPVLWQAAHAALQQQQHEMSPPNATASQEPPRKRSRATAGVAAAAAPTTAANADSANLASTVAEVFDELPATCARLLLSAQAGWMLPPPPLHLQGRKQHKTNGGSSAVDTAAPRRRRQNDSTSDTDSQCSHSSSSSTSTSNGNRHDGGMERNARGSRRNAEQDAPRPSDLSPHEADPTREDGGRMTRAQARELLSKVTAAGVCNRCYSMLAEGTLMTLPQSAPRLHKEVEEDLEKYLWDDAHALMTNSSLVVAHLVPAIRLTYTQNIVLKRFLLKLENLLEAMQKIEGAVTEELAATPGTAAETAPAA